MIPWFIATERFGPWDEDRWARYIEWSGLIQLDELVSLDAMLNPPVLRAMKDSYWPKVPENWRMFGLFTDLDFLRKEITGVARCNLLCVFRNPSEAPVLPSTPIEFELLGYDLIEVEGSTSALSNCGGFPQAFSDVELSKNGLLPSHLRACQVQESLRALYPLEDHADCDVWAIARAAASKHGGQPDLER
jgi:hypothetical protein